MTEKTPTIVSRKEAKRKGLKFYFTGVPCIRGHLSKRYTNHASCMGCNNFFRAEYIKKGDTKYYESHRAGRKRWQQNNPIRYKLQAIKSGAKRRKIHFDLKVSDIPAATHCKACGIEFDTSPGRPRSNSPSIDRVNNALGYILGNIALICHRCNGLKRDSTVEDLKRIIAYIEANSPITD